MHTPAPSKPKPRFAECRKRIRNEQKGIARRKDGHPHVKVTHKKVETLRTQLGVNKQVEMKNKKKNKRKKETRDRADERSEQNKQKGRNPEESTILSLPMTQADDFKETEKTSRRQK